VGLRTGRAVATVSGRARGERLGCETADALKEGPAARAKARWARQEAAGGRRARRLSVVVVVGSRQVVDEPEARER
jgi:hypothetical protein